MWDKKIIVSNHVKCRFKSRNVKFEKNNDSIVIQILRDLKPLNVLSIENLSEGIYRVNTKHGKTYILKQIDEKVMLVQTVYKTKSKYKPMAKIG